MAGGAVAALETIVLQECGLHWMKLPVDREAFNGCDPITLVHDRECQARVDPTTVDMNGTGAALTVVASFFRSEKFEMFA